MQKKLEKGKGSFYDIELVFTTDDYDNSKEAALKVFQKDLSLPGFRKWFVPLNLVEEQIQPEYVSLTIYENLINKWLQAIVSENAEIKFIGEPYDVKQDKKWEDTVVKLKLDVFPDVEIKKDGWQKLPMKEIKVKVEKKEIDEAFLRLRKNYADYKDVDVMTRDSIAKVSMSFLDKAGKEIDKWTLYVWEPEFEEFPFFVDNFISKKKWEEFKLKYQEKELPPTVQTKKSDLKPVEIAFVLTDIKDVVLPEINEEMLLKLFGKDSEVKNESELLNFIETSISEQKFNTELINQIEEFLSKIRETYMSVNIPKTLLDQETHVRIESLEKRFGWKEQMEAYLQQMWEDKAKTFVEDISSAAKESLEKFFILQKVASDLELDVNWEQPVDMEIENKLYQKLLAKESKSTEKKSEKK